MLKRALAVTLSFLATSTALGGELGAAPRRVASNNLCSDQFLLAFAEPQQILALSPNAADPTISYYAAIAAPFPRIRDDAETVLALNPDLVLTSSYARPAAIALLRRRGIAIETAAEGEPLAAIPAEMRRVGSILGASSRADALAAALEKKLVETAGAFSKHRLTALIYEHGGYMQGPGSVISAVLAHLGVRNAAETLTRDQFASANVEEIIALRPDFLIVQETAPGVDEGSALLLHPALSALYPPGKRIVLPPALTLCEGPSTLRLIDTAVEQLRAKLAAANEASP